MSRLNYEIFPVLNFIAQKSIKERRYIKCPVYKRIVSLYNFIVSNYVESSKPANQKIRCNLSNIKLLNLSVSCEYDVLVVLFVIFVGFSIFELLFILQQSLLKTWPLLDLHNLCFSNWDHNMLQNVKNQIYSNSTGLLTNVLS
jgi:hypothetical protein